MVATSTSDISESSPTSTDIFLRTAPSSPAVENSRSTSTFSSHASFSSSDSFSFLTYVPSSSKYPSFRSCSRLKGSNAASWSLSSRASSVASRFSTPCALAAFSVRRSERCLTAFAIISCDIEWSIGPTKLPVSSGGLSPRSLLLLASCIFRLNFAASSSARAASTTLELVSSTSRRRGRLLMAPVKFLRPNDHRFSTSK
mmetsp:Transcript_6591/g.24861  ORF Transcript_6591/g.24861 Transcript_6591/m.24861 type:complete len:200 (-) Transcript_6591:1-600(-)